MDKELSEYPEEMLSYIAHEASCDAERVIAFLNDLCLHGSPENPLKLPRGFLLHLGAALRMLEWEKCGFRVHVDAGLPCAAEVIKSAFGSLHRHDWSKSELAEAVVRLACERFAWAGPSELGANILLDELPGDEALDAIANFLWAMRHNPQSTNQ